MSITSGVFNRNGGDDRCQQESATPPHQVNSANMDAEFNDFAGAINQTFFRDGSAVATGNWDLGGFNITNLGEISGDWEFNSGTLTIGGGSGTPTVSVGLFASWTFENEPVFNNGIDVKGGPARFKGTTTFYGNTGSYSGFITMADNPVIYGDFSTASNEKLTIMGNLVLDKTAPATAGESGEPGEIRVDDDFIYVKPPGGGDWKTVELKSFQTVGS